MITSIFGAPGTGNTAASDYSNGPNTNWKLTITEQSAKFFLLSSLMQFSQPWCYVLISGSLNFLSEEIKSLESSGRCPDPLY